MSDFQRVISVLRGLGIGVTVENDGLLQMAKIEGKNISGYFANNEDYATELKEQADHIEVLEKRLENAIFTTQYDPEPNKIIPLDNVKLNAFYKGRLPVPPERD